MTPMLILARADLRARARFWVSLATVIALAACAVIALAAGARRTATAYPRFLTTQRASDAALYLGGTSLTAATVAALPEVADSSVILGLPTLGPAYAAGIVTDGRLGVTLDRYKFLAGHNVRANDPFGVVIGFALASSRHLALGSPVRIEFTEPEGDPVPVSLRVVGIEASPGEFPPLPPTALNTVSLSPGFLSTPVGQKLAPFAFPTITVRLRRGRDDINRFSQDIGGSGPGGQLLSMQTSAEAAANTERSLRLQADALWLVAGFVALASALVLAQLFAREASFEAASAEPLRALGMTTGQLAGAGLIRAALATLAGAAVGSIGAAAASPLLPIGAARIAEPNPGLRLDALALGLGGAGVVASVLLLAGVALATGLRPSRQHPGTETIGARLPVGRLPVVVAMGIRVALTPGRGRDAVPVRTTITSIAIAAAATAAALTYGGSLNHLLAEPALYGVNFAAHVEAVATGPNSDARPLVPILEADTAIAALTLGETQIPLQSGSLVFGGQRQSPVRGSIAPVLVSGRLPRSGDEIALGATTIRQLHRGTGQTIALRLQGVPMRPAPMRIVGVAILPSIADNEGLGKGAVLDQGFSEYALRFTAPGVEPGPPGDLFVRFARGVPTGPRIAALQDAVTSSANVYPAEQPTDVANFAEVRVLPQILAGVLGLLALATTLHLVVSAVRRRRRELAVLRTLGMVPRQVSGLVWCQATTIALTASGVGVPLGVALGRWAWSVVASGLGVVARPWVPLPLALGLVPAAAVMASLVAIGPALAAGRIPPGTALQAE